MKLSVAVSNGFNWPVTFSVSGAPSGLTPTFSVPTIPAPGSGSTALQFAANASLTAGTYTITVTASGGTISQKATLTLTVNAIVPKCSFTASPTSLTLSVSQATNVRLSCTSPQGNLPSSLALAVSGQPTGVTTSFSPATLTPGTALTTMTIVTTTAAQAGSYTLAVTASGGTFSQTINLPMNLVVAPSISLKLASSSLSAIQATPVTVGVTLANIGTFNSTTSLALSGMPIGMTGSFSPASFPAPGGGSSTLTLTPSTNTPPGKYTINVVGSGGGLVVSVPVTVLVAAAPNFTLTTSAAATAIQAGQASYSLLLTVGGLTGGFNAPVTFSVTGLPTGVTGTFSATTVAAPGTGTANLTLAAASTATAGQYKLTITATGGGVSQSAGLLLTVIGLPGFTLKTNVTSLALAAGGAFTTTVSLVGQNGFNSPVTLSLGTLPAGVSATLSSTTISTVNGTALLTIQTAGTMANGTYSVSVSGTSSVIATAQPSQTAAVTIIVGTVATSLSATSVTVPRGSSGSVTVTTTAANFTGTVSFSASGVPPYVSYGFSPTNLAGSGTSQMTISVGASATIGTYTIMVRTGAGGTTSQVPLTLIIH